MERGDDDDDGEQRGDDGRENTVEVIRGVSSPIHLGGDSNPSPDTISLNQEASNGVLLATVIPQKLQDDSLPSADQEKRQTEQSLNTGEVFRASLGLQNTEKQWRLENPFNPSNKVYQFRADGRRKSQHQHLRWRRKRSKVEKEAPRGTPADTSAFQSLWVGTLGRRSSPRRNSRCLKRFLSNSRRKKPMLPKS